MEQFLIFADVEFQVPKFRGFDIHQHWQCGREYADLQAAVELRLTAFIWGNNLIVNNFPFDEI
jgi:hypothetical protein